MLFAQFSGLSIGGFVVLEDIKCGDNGLNNSNEVQELGADVKKKDE